MSGAAIPSLNVESIYLDVTNGVVQTMPASYGDFIAPGVTYTGSNTNYFTLTSTNNLINVSDWVNSTFYCGSVFKLSWQSVSNQTYLIQYSTNQVDWVDIRVYNVGDGFVRVWYDSPMGRFYRLATPGLIFLVAPLNFRILGGA